MLCNEVLRTALQTLVTLPPLSLADETASISLASSEEIGSKSLGQIMDFLASCCFVKETGDEEGK